MMGYKLKNTVFALVGFFYVLNAVGQTAGAESILGDFYHRPDKVLVAAHRAAHQNFPENSMAALEESIRLGVDIVELDVRMTKDNVPVILHDRTVDRTTNGKGKISEMTLNEAKSLKLLHLGLPTQQVIPTLDEVLAMAKDKILIDIDFKVDSMEALEKTVGLIKKYGMQGQVIFYLYDYRLSPVLHSMSPELIIMPRAYKKKDINQILKWDYIRIIHVDESFYKERLMRKIMDSNVRVWINALGKYDAMEMEGKNSGFSKLFQKKYINVVQTNLPEELIEYLKGESG